MRISDWSSDVCSSDLGLDGIFAAGVARKNPLYTNMLIIDRQSSGSERVTRETAKALTRKNLDMDFGGAAIINDAASGERYEIARASRLSCLLAKGGVARSEEHTSELQ